MTRPPLVITGGPAAGKSTTGRHLASTTPRSAFIDVDDIRQLVKNGGAAPWDGQEGASQHLLGVRNTAALARNFLSSGINVTVADVLDTATLAAYRRLVPNVIVVRLVIDLGEARRRAGLRPAYLTDREFEELHRRQEHPLAVDHELDVSALDLDSQIEAVRRLWAAGP